MKISNFAHPEYQKFKSGRKKSSPLEPQKILDVTNDGPWVLSQRNKTFFLLNLNTNVSVATFETKKAVEKLPKIDTVFYYGTLNQIKTIFAVFGQLEIPVCCRFLKQSSKANTN